MAKPRGSYALIHFPDKKPLKKSYDTCTKAYFDYESKGCTFVELFDARGVLLASYPVRNP